MISSFLVIGMLQIFVFAKSMSCTMYLKVLFVLPRVICVGDVECDFKVLRQVSNVFLMRCRDSQLPSLATLAVHLMKFDEIVFEYCNGNVNTVFSKL